MLILLEGDWVGKEVVKKINLMTVSAEWDNNVSVFSFFSDYFTVPKTLLRLYKNLTQCLKNIVSHTIITTLVLRMNS